MNLKQKNELSKKLLKNMKEIEIEFLSNQQRLSDPYHSETITAKRKLFEHVSIDRMLKNK